ncbi:hypothetical protein [Alicyclobacillus ferrooxydans]|uniref:Sin domain-containing protein n=1 Tax=Alicyclobacillus ferrooxydans TaxID=471514 RepID=A0A0P9C2Z9_9BACL|nr:hypothetical protein [Alicyclobacillus ferrooxydans]KPV39348.1 hypothetical protein AN477_22945 [Alicyclobacillus ferrooxydans]
MINDLDALLGGLEVPTEREIHTLDVEWARLIIAAKEAGLTVEAIQQFLAERSPATRTDDILLARAAD